MSTSSQPCNSTALAPRSFRFPYMTYLLRISIPMAGVAQRLKAVSVISLRSQCRPRWVFRPYSFITAPWRNPAFTTRSHTTSQNSSYAIPSKFWCFSFAKYRTLRKNPQTQYSCGFADLFLQNDRFWKCLLTFWTTCYILYLSQILSVFAKYDTLRNFLSIGRKKHGTFFTYRVFVYSPAAYPPPTSSPRSQV